MSFRNTPTGNASGPGHKRVIALGLMAAVIAAMAIADNDRASAALAGAALLGVGLLLVIPVRKPAR